MDTPHTEGTWVEGRLTASGPTYGAVSGCSFTVATCGSGDSEWRIRNRAREEVLVVRHGSDPAIFVRGQLASVVPELYGHVLALRHPGAHLQGVLENATFELSASGSETTIVSRQGGERIVTLTVNAFGWVTSKTVRIRGELTDRVELTDLVQRPDQSRLATGATRTLHDLQAGPSWFMGSAADP